MGVLDGRRVLVVGASAGIGRAVALHAVREGARVLAVARRPERLRELVEEAGGGTSLAADVSDEDDCVRIADEARATLGDVDLLLHAAATAPLRRLRDTTGDEWRSTLATNLIGVNLLIGATLPVLAPTGIVSVLSSETIGQPRAGLAAYSASKAALEESVRCWHTEHPGVRFSVVAVGSTVPTEFGSGFDLELLTEVMGDWALHGLAQSEFMDTGEVGDFLVHLYAAALPYPQVNIEHLLLRSPSGLMPDAQKLIAHAEATIPSD
ncbi:MAG TPA: SDR family oxidoreductase [Acidimicrobiia bacterium]|nr:SDR family oxidoreductase [Acidimicrobiia bacterium]